MLDNPVALILALVGVGGLGGFAREIASGLTKIRSGISAKESNRKRDLVSERDYEYDRAEAEARNRRRTEEHAARLRRIMIENGLESQIPKWPRMETIPDRVPGQPITVDQDPPSYNRRSTDREEETSDVLQQVLENEVLKDTDKKEG